MGTISKELIDEYKAIHKEKYGEELSDEDAHEAAHNLANFAKLVYDMWVKDEKKKRKLKECSEGFCLEAELTYTCPICRRNKPGDEIWYDKLGQKCIDCTRNIKEGVIPSFVAKNSESFYSMFELDYYFGIKSRTARKLIKEGKLHMRELKLTDGTIYANIFLKKENQK